MLDETWWQEDKNNHIQQDIKMNFHGLYYNLDKVSFKEIYNIIIKSNKEIPVGFYVWKNHFTFENVSYFIKKNLTFSFHFLKDNRMNMFGWNLLHNITAINHNLYRLKISDNPNCVICSNCDNYNHYFLKCKCIGQ